MIPETTIEEIKSRVDIVEVIGRELALKKQGRDYFGCCPFHSEKTPSFSVSPSKQFYKCFGCGAGGNAYQFLMDYKKINFVDAVKILAAEAGVELPENTGQWIPNTSAPRLPRKTAPAPARRTAAPPASDRWVEKATKFATGCHEQLLDNEKAMAALYRKRGLGKKAVKKYFLGLNSENYFRYRKAWELPEERKENGRPKKLWIPAGLVIPNRNGAGQVNRLRIGRKKGEKPKYFVVPGSSTANMLINPEKRVQVVVENELDAMLVAAATADNVGAVAIGGASTALDATAIDVLDAAQVILLAMDVDPAGKKGVAKLMARYDRAIIWPVPAGKDPGDYRQAGGSVKAWIREGLPPGWRFGCTALETETGGKGKSEACFPTIPDGLIKLQQLLKKTRIRLRPSEIITDRNWHRATKEDRRAIQDLMFFDDGVRENLTHRSETYINHENILTTDGGLF